MSRIPESLAEQQRAAFAASIDQVALLERMIRQLGYLSSVGLASLTWLASHIAHDERHSDHGEHLHRAVEAEIAPATRATGAQTTRRAAHAEQLPTSYSEVSAAFALGDLSLRHTEVVVEAGQVITASNARSRFEAAVLSLALTMTPTQLRPHARRLAQTHRPTFSCS